MRSPTHRFTRRAAAVGAIAGLVAGRAAAQQGHNPFPATPVGDASASGWQVANVAPLALDGFPIAISPDGAAIAGVGSDGSLCVWPVEGGEPTRAAFPDFHIDPDSIAWAPDSSAIAFSTLAFQYFYDGDIYVFEVADGAIHNITDDGLEKVSLISEDQEPVPIDVMPAWMPDSKALVFSRTVFDDRDELSNEIMRVPRAGGEPATLLSIPGMPGAIFLPMRALQDGSILYPVGFSDLSEPQNGLWRLPPNGDPVQLMPGDEGAAFPIPMINDVWEGDGELRISGQSAALIAQFEITRPWAFTWSSATGEAVALAPASDAPGTVVYPGPYSPDGETLLTLERPAGQQPVASLQGPVASTAELPEASAEAGPGRPRYVTGNWSETNLALIPPLLTNAGYLLTMEPAG